MRPFLSWRFAHLIMGCTILGACSNETTRGGTDRGAGSAGMTTGTTGITTTTTGSSGTGSSTTSTATGSGGASGGSSTTSVGGSGGAAADAASDAWGGGSGGQAGAADGGFPPLMECAKPSVDRLENWEASGEGKTIPATGNCLVKEGDHYVAKVEFVNNEWHVLPVYLGNVFGAQVDLSASSGFLLTYSSTSDMYAQLRPAPPHWDGGDQYATTIPSTGGTKKSQFFSFAKENWKSIFKTPAWTFDSALQTASALVFVGEKANLIVFSGLRIDRYVPPCR